MPTIPAEEYEITIFEGSWRLIPTADVLSTRPVFQVTRGAGIVEYTPEFGQQHKLPGTVMSIEYVQAVVVGYDEKTRRWLLGFHIGRSSQDKAHWLEVVCWPPGDNSLYGAAAQQAGRELAEYIGCPLKIFGAKKLARPLGGAAGGGVTGPLAPHKREDIGPQQVRLLAHSIKLPIQYTAVWLGPSRNGVTLRLSKEATTGKQGVAPSFNQCVIDTQQGLIRLIPPTGLLGSFLGGAQGRAIKVGIVRNVELRYVIDRKSVPQEMNGDILTEITMITHRWEIYLTLPDESLLLAQTSHQTSSELSRKRTMAGNKFAVNTSAGIDYLRQHQADQEAFEAARSWAENAAIVVAGTLGVALAKTQVDDEGAG